MYDSWGIGYVMTNGHMEICHNPLRDCTIDEMMAYEFPDPGQVDRKRIDTWAAQAKVLHEQTDYAVIAEDVYKRQGQAARPPAYGSGWPGYRNGGSAA